MRHSVTLHTSNIWLQSSGTLGRALANLTRKPPTPPHPPPPPSKNAANSRALPTGANQAHAAWTRRLQYALWLHVCLCVSVRHYCLCVCVCRIYYITHSGFADNESQYKMNNWSRILHFTQSLWACYHVQCNAILQAARSIIKRASTHTYWHTYTLMFLRKGYWFKKKKKKKNPSGSCLALTTDGGWVLKLKLRSSVLAILLKGWEAFLIFHSRLQVCTQGVRHRRERETIAWEKDSSDGSSRSSRGRGQKRVIFLCWNKNLVGNTLIIP